MTNLGFNTQRLIVRPITIEDAPFVLELMNTPKWIKFIGDRNVHSVEEAEGYIKEKALPQLKTHGHTNNVVIRKKDGTKMGTCGIYHREGTDEVDIGFAFLPPYEGKGYAYEASSELMKFAKNQLKLNTIQAYTLEENTASRKLLERLGLELIGTGYLPNNNEELLMYRKTFEK
ncbi:GNAT family N-acetyltransferase [Winogradskyella vincentii]|uniref:GNAT family N-acetyltransferase n=1 Tax=Winogradskyella vincentii TaxID=2877122 RepID=A0ABS7XZ05_9FLAO|nr:GNAT family N-acetyltransferase [Winogradskyella vincentii]MCA0152887.1 GNAT family N-acetyltransferase [Winogradskyella vincentii]